MRTSFQAALSGKPNQMSPLHAPVPGEALLNSLYVLLSKLSRDAGSVDRRQLVARLGSAAPPPPQRATRRERLMTLIDASESRVRGALEALGVSGPLATDLARDALDAPFEVATLSPITLITGSIGVGKTTELERRHRSALLAALDDESAPIPIHIRAQRLRTESLEPVVASEAHELGDPRRCGVYLTIDGLDEAGIDIREHLPDFHTLRARMPGSSVVVSSRVAPEDYRGEKSQVPPLTSARAHDLIARLRPDGFAHVYGRSERVDLLTRPLFAIEYALGGSDRTDRLTEAQLIAGIGQRVTKSIGEEVFEALVTLAASYVDRGGAPVPPGEFGLTPPEVRNLLQSRLVLFDGDGLRLQLAVLTEWLASFALLSEEHLLDRTTESPTLAWRWRYVHAQALLQANADQADRLLRHLVARSPGTAAWVLKEARDQKGPSTGRAFTESRETRRRRLLVAYATWYSALPAIDTVVQPANPNTKSTIYVNEDRLTVATRPAVNDGDSLTVASVPPMIDDGWTRIRSGGAPTGAKWSWEWAFEDAEDALEKWLEAGAGLESIPSAVPELAYAFAATVLGTNRLTMTDAIDVVQLQERISSHRRQHPLGNVRIVEGREAWDLVTAERFVQALLACGYRSIKDPWPSSDSNGGWTWLRWSPEQFRRKLEAVTREALNIYQEIVERSLPGLGSTLATYLLLPGRVVGTVTPAKADEGWAGQPLLNWEIEPLRADEPNASEWTLTEREKAGGFGETNWEEKARTFRQIRGVDPETVTFTKYGGLPEIYEDRPASHLALSLLSSDLERIAWGGANVRLDRATHLAPTLTEAILGERRDG